MPAIGTPIAAPESAQSREGTANERFTDGLIHQSLYFLDSSGTATFAACSPISTLEAHDAFEATPAFTADAAFVIYGENTPDDGLSERA